MINKQGKFEGFLWGEKNATQNVGRNLCEFCAFLWLLQHLFDQAIDVDAGRVEEVDAVVLVRAQ
jgi:hypothetical protein